MTDIKRYTYDEGDGNWRFPGHVKKEDGDWVWYKDHVVIVKALEEKIARLDEELADRRKSVW